jgi:5-methylcytosine-specific restriction endonuclease McrA
MQRGTTNSPNRGSAADRRRRKCWLLATFGDGISCPCFSCKQVLLFSKLQSDRIIPGILGGTYRRENLRPSCSSCNIRTGNAVRDLLRQGTAREEVIALCVAGAL